MFLVPAFVLRIDVGSTHKKYLIAWNRPAFVLSDDKVLPGESEVLVEIRILGH